MRSKTALEDLRGRLRAAAEPERAEALRRFFKTGPGEYGEGDVFLGVPVPAARKITRRFDDLAEADVLELLRSPVHEERFVALVMLVRRYERRDGAVRDRIYETYLENTAWIDNWDLVDVSAPHVVGAHLLGRDRMILDRLARSSSLWERRISIMATFAFIRAGDLDDTFRLARVLLRDDQDLIHKATGWMLREAGKRDERRLIDFLEEHAPEMPRTMLRYAVERLDPGTRKRLMNAG